MISTQCPFGHFDSSTSNVDNLVITTSYDLKVLGIFYFWGSAPIPPNFNFTRAGLLTIIKKATVLGPPYEF